MQNDVFLYTKGAFNGWYTWISGIFFMSGQVDRTATIKKCLYIDACRSLYYWDVMEIGNLLHSQKNDILFKYIHRLDFFFVCFQFFLTTIYRLPFNNKTTKKCISGGKVTVNFYVSQPTTNKFLFNTRYMLLSLFVFIQFIQFSVFLLKNPFRVI